ncbi:MAG: ABC transporter substrate-binding protein [Acidimicrobiales bacterium]
MSGCSSSAALVPPSVTQGTLPGGYLLETSGTVTVGVRSLPRNFNPSTPAGDNRITQMVMEQVLPQPFVTDPTFGLQTSGLLVSAEVQSVSPLTVVYVINPAAMWSDGVPITVTDFTYAWHEQLATSGALAASGLVAGYRDIASIVGSDGGRTVTVTFSQPFSQWQALFANLVPAHIAERYGWSKAFAGYSPAKVISGGPFEISSYTAGRQLTLTRNPRYWGPAAHVARIRFLVEPSEAALVAGIESGSLSIAEVNGSSPSAGVLGPGAVGVGGNPVPRTGAKAQRRVPIAFSSGAAEEIWQLSFNFDNALMSKIAIRRGIEHALDRSEIVADSEDLVDPHIHVALSRLTLPGESTSPSASGTTPVIQHAPDLYQPAAALSSFRAAGYWPGEGGLLRPAGVGAPLQVKLLEPSGNWAVDQAALVIQAELRAIGLTVDIQQRRLSKMLSTLLPEGAYQIALAPFEVSATEATMPPEYTDSVLPPSVPATFARGGTGRARISGIAGAAPAIPSTTVVPSSGGSVPPSSNGQLWATTAATGTEPGAVSAGAVTRDVSGVDDAVLTRYFTQALAELNPPTAIADLQQADDFMWNQVVTIPLFQPGFDLMRSARVDNVSESPTWAGPMWDAEDWAILKQAPPAPAHVSRSAG